MTGGATARELAGRLGLKRSGRAWRGDCPTCSYRGGLSLTEARDGRAGRPRCWGCGWQGDAESHGQDLRRDPAEAATRRQAAIDRAARAWDRGRPIRPGDPAALYLASRGLVHLIGNPELRQGEAHHPDYPGRPNEPGHPTLFAAIRDASGGLTGIQRTYLTDDGRKRFPTAPRATLGECWGGSIRLQPWEPGRALIVAEGLETAASAGLILGLPAWAAVSCGNLASGLILPPAVRAILIAADADAPGRHAADAAARRWRREDREARVRFPTCGTDFNDQLLMGGGRGRG